MKNHFPSPSAFVGSSIPFFLPHLFPFLPNLGFNSLPLNNLSYPCLDEGIVAGDALLHDEVAPVEGPLLSSLNQGKIETMQSLKISQNLLSQNRIDKSILHILLMVVDHVSESMSNINQPRIDCSMLARS